jgi:DNA-binding MarR family transcriptional regulator
MSPKTASATRRRPLATKTPAAPAAPPDLPAQVLRQFRQIFNSVKAHFQQVEKRAGIGGAQVWALATVKDRPGLGVGELAQAMDIHPSTASNLVRALLERDFLEVRREWEDRRAVQLHLRPAGVRALAKAPEPFAGVLPDALGRLEPARLRRLHRDLEDLIARLDADETAAQVPLANESPVRGARARAGAPTRGRRPG